MAELIARAGGLFVRSSVARVTLIYWLSRLLSGGLMLMFAAQQGPSSYTGASPDYVSFANFWDARWYAYIAQAGYPSALPLDAAGHVAQNAWAFLPVYPFLVGGIAAITQLSWSFAAVAVSLLAGWAFMFVLYRLMRDRLTAAQATWAVVFASVAPAAPIFGVGYAEALFLLLLALALLLLTHRSYWLLAAVLPVLAFTRPGALAFAVTLAVHWVVRWRARSTDRFGIAARIGVAALAMWSVVLGFAWVWIAAAVTGVHDAYLQTELSWRAAYIGWNELVPGTAWFQAANWWFGQPWTVIVPLTALAITALVLMLPATRKLGHVLWGWIAAYGLYLFLVFFPQSSSVRLLAPMFPVAGVLAQVRSLSIKLGICLVFVLGQIWWLYTSWTVIGSDWTPP